MSKAPKNDEPYSEAETARRRDAIVRNMIATPPKPRAVTKKKTKRKSVRKRDSE